MARIDTKARPPNKICATKLPVTLIVNGVEKKLEVAPRTALLDALRDHLNPFAAPRDRNN
jgi:hypothetical protein